MSLHESTNVPSALQPRGAGAPHVRRGLRARRREVLLRTGALVLAFLLLGSSAVPAWMQQWRVLDGVVQGWDWDLVNWEVANVSAKLQAVAAQPIQNLSVQERSALVKQYLNRANEIADLESQVGALYGEQITLAQVRRREQLQGELKILRQDQNMVRHAVEQVIEAQIGQLLVTHGLRIGDTAFPPVFFTFSEPPRKLVVSPRDRIDTTYYAMLQPDLPPEKREQIEDTIFTRENLSALVTNIGGLGAYPTLVVDRAPLEWVLSTVAHEWTHNYLTLYPLGISYTNDGEVMTINETVADIVGDEIGKEAMRAFYPELIYEHPGKDQSAPLPGERNAETFDFDKEMRQTRETVDLFLKYGRVEDAEEYMEIRRLLFVENGYNIRKLNQAYFAFHGAYATGAAATSPIGPKLQELRAAAPSVRAFLETVRWFTAEHDLDQALSTWRERTATPG